MHHNRGARQAENLQSDQVTTATIGHRDMRSGGYLRKGGRYEQRLMEETVSLGVYHSTHCSPHLALAPSCRFVLCPTLSVANGKPLRTSDERQENNSSSHL